MSEENKMIVQKLQEKILSEQNEALMEEALQNNQVEFVYKNIHYRIKKPNFGQKQEVYKKKILKFSELLKDPNYMMEKDLKAQYKARGIDLDAMQDKIIALEQEKQNYQIKLGEALSNKASKDDLESLKNHIAEIQNNQIQISMTKNSYLEFCIEQQVFTYAYTFLTFLITEKKLEDGTYVRAWEKFEEFEKETEDLIREVSFYATLVMKDELVG